jgi:hypothetical protein
MPEASDAHLRMAGMALAHAVWSIEDGETLCTMSMLEDADGERSVTRYEADTIPESIEDALAELKDRLVDGAFAVLLYDGFYTSDDGEKRDALIGELLTATAPSATGNTAAQVGRIVQQYMPGKKSFLRKTRVKLLGAPFIRGNGSPETSAALIAGALEHEKVADLFEGLVAA